MGKYRILVVEDEEAIGRLLCMNLKVAGYEVTYFSDGLETVKSLESDFEYDLALLDIMIPGVDGFGILEKLKPHGIPVIFLTAKVDIESKLRGLTEGAEDYIVKPFNVLEVLIRVEKVLSRSGKGTKEIVVGEIVIDEEERTVTKNGETISLKPMEFDLLVVLAKNKNRAISRDKLLNLVWGTEFMGESRTVDVHIGQLRKKLGLADSIKTISKLGYRLED